MRQERKRSRRRGQATLAQKVDEIVTLLASKPAGVGGYSEGVTPASGPVPETPVTLQTLVIDDAEAEALLCSFRQNQASFAPFVEIAEGATASSLRSEKPLFFLSVMVAACHRDSARQENFSRASMALIADQVLVRGQKNLALLQGMLVLLNWYQTQVLINPQITNLLHLCIALATDLGLNQSPMTAETHTLTHGAIKAIHGPAVYPESRTLEEQRAYAGCFYLSSVIATSSSISTELPWSAQLEESCHVLGRSERDGDVRLATHLRLQRIISQIAQVQKEITANGGLAASLTVYTTPFEERLTQLWNDCPETIRQDGRLDRDCLTLSVSLMSRCSTVKLITGLLVSFSPHPTQPPHRPHAPLQDQPRRHQTDDRRRPRPHRRRGPPTRSPPLPPRGSRQPRGVSHRAAATLLPPAACALHPGQPRHDHARAPLPPGLRPRVAAARVPARPARARRGAH